MKSVALNTLVASSVVGSALAVTTGDKWVNFKNLQQKPRAKFSERLSRASSGSTDQVAIQNQQQLYAIELAVGTPAQNIQVQLDTGSSDLWFPVTGSVLCQGQTSECQSYGSFTPGSSSTLQNLNQNFSIGYGDGTMIQGNSVTDVVTIGADTLKNVQFAACNAGSSSTGIQGLLGIGYETNEAAISSGTGPKYPNLVADLQSQGFINTMAYSLWLNDPNAADGNILFGGVDSDKYSGTLISMPVVPDQNGAYTQLTIPLTEMSISAGGTDVQLTPNGYFYPALVDSGTTIMLLPNDVAQAIVDALGAQVQQGQPYLPCSFGNDATAKLSFQFNGANGATIDVPLSELLEPMTTGSTDGNQVCQLLIGGGASDGVIILGDSFMRAAYLVYDLTNNQIAIAPSKFNVQSSNIQAISGSSIPGASVMSSLVGASAVPTSAIIPGQQTSAPVTGDNGPSALETTAPIPTLHINTSSGSTVGFITATQTGPAGGNPTGTSSGGLGGPTKNAAPVAAAQVSTFGILAVISGVVTLLSLSGGALMILL